MVRGRCCQRSNEEIFGWLSPVRDFLIENMIADFHFFQKKTFCDFFAQFSSDRRDFIIVFMSVDRSITNCFFITLSHCLAFRLIIRDLFNAISREFVIMCKFERRHCRGSWGRSSSCFKQRKKKSLRLVVLVSLLTPSILLLVKVRDDRFLCNFQWP